MPEAGPIEDYAGLIAVLQQRQPTLGRRMQQVAQFVMNNPEDVAIHNIVELARQAGVHPSAISRFAKELGFGGFADLQKVFLQRLVGPKMNYLDRMQALAGTAERPSGELDLAEPALVFDIFIRAAMDTLLRLRDDMDRTALEGFVDVLLEAAAVHVVAARGAYGVGAYCYYSLSRVGKRAFLVDNQGSMRKQQLASVGDGDVLLVLTFDDYTAETIEIAKAAHRQQKTLLVITDNELSPVAALGRHTLFVKEARLGHFRSQVPAMVLCQSIIVSVGRLISRR
ncbi:MAG TPA: MurR/RpiR family transcriptional regulator [Devosiaceae bacterium]|nr:MurR/RpiR family transcriptional regulator [Devosiaceae bacterium]